MSLHLEQPGFPDTQQGKLYASNPGNDRAYTAVVAK